jgi:hypothetical protein
MSVSLSSSLAPSAEDLACAKKAKDCEVLDLGLHEDVWGAQFDFLGRDSAFHDL